MLHLFCCFKLWDFDSIGGSRRHPDSKLVLSLEYCTFLRWRNWEKWISYLIFWLKKFNCFWTPNLDLFFYLLTILGWNRNSSVLCRILTARSSYTCRAVNSSPFFLSFAIFRFGSFLWWFCGANFDFAVWLVGDFVKFLDYWTDGCFETKLVFSGNFNISI